MVEFEALQKVAVVISVIATIVIVGISIYSVWLSRKEVQKQNTRIISLLESIDKKMDKEK